MFVDTQRFLPDVAKRADIALDLDAYGMAGDLYWLWVKHADTSKGSAATKLPLAHFLYCVDQLDANGRLGRISNSIRSERGFQSRRKTSTRSDDAVPRTQGRG